MAVAEPLLQLPVRRGRNTAALILLVAVSGLALYVAYQERAELGLGHWWVAVFPVLMLATAYRLLRPRVPIAVDGQGVRVVAGNSLLALRTTIEWKAIRRLRVTAAGMLLIEMKDAERWSEGRPWLVRANIRANQRKHGAAVVQPLRELKGPPASIVASLRGAAPVPVEAPQALWGRG